MDVIESNHAQLQQTSTAWKPWTENVPIRDQEAGSSNPFAPTIYPIISCYRGRYRGCLNRFCGALAKNVAHLALLPVPVSSPCPPFRFAGEMFMLQGLHQEP